MATHGKKYEKARELINNVGALPVKQALAKVKELAFAKFDESVDVDINLGIDPTKPEHNVRGSVVLPSGTGRKVKILVFAKGDHADRALKAGADYVGTTEFADKILAGWLDFNYVIATPDMMWLVGKLAKVLGPRGLLPNAKVGTVTFEVENIISELKKGKTFFKNNKVGQVHLSIGKVSFDVDKLDDNFVTFVKALVAAKPASAKGQFIKKITVSSTMGPGIEVKLDEVLK
jgi:large subunit ribosomal protein L1